MRQLRRDEYTVGWVCALPVELAAAQEMLDEEHETPQSETNDTNAYTCGRVGEHNVVIACLPEGQTGTNSAAAVAVQMKSAFPSTRFGLMVGIGGGVPSEEADIRLGDVVVSKPHNVHGGVVQYDFGKTTPGGFERTGFLNTPPTVLLNAVSDLRAKQMRGKSRLSEYLFKFESLPDFTREAAGPDTLFDATFDHAGGATCSQCNSGYVVTRKPRRQEVMVHYGTIASGNRVMRSATERDKISADLGGVLCFEMEAAGLMNSFPCLVIRGICDYADSHKNKRWQPYAASTAAACAKEVLSVMPPAEIAQTRKAEFVIASNELLPLLYENTCIYEESKIRNRERVPGTCEWFTNHTLFKQWKSPSNTQVSSLLYVTADPGCGKSVLSRYLIDEILPEAGKTVCYFFFKDDFEQQKSSTSALCSLLHQLFDRNPHLLTDEVLTGYINRGKGFLESFENLWHIFLLATDSQKTFCVLDALDECRDGDRKQLIDAICSITSSKITQHNGPRFLLTSRPYEHIRAHFSIKLTSMASIHLQGDQGPTADAIAKEIQIVLDTRINETAKFFRLEPDERLLMKTQLASVPNRTYLWITLVFDGLMKRKSGVSKGDIMNLIRQPPQSVYDVYEQILNKSPDRQDARRLLHIIIGAKQPLSLAEMSIALAFKNQQSVDSVSERIIPCSRIGTHVRALCGLFAIVIDNKVYLLHQTAREFLIHDDTEGSSREPRHNVGELSQVDSAKSHIWRHSIILENANTALAEICILYLLSEVAIPRSPLLEYAATYWVVHYRQSPQVSQIEMANMARRLCLLVTRYPLWTGIHSINTRSFLGRSPLLLASSVGLETIVRRFLFEQYSIGNNPESKLRSHSNRIRWRLLQIKQSYKVKRDKEFRKDVQEALYYAAYNSHLAVVKLLLQTKVQVNYVGFSSGRMPLGVAAARGDEAIVKLLIRSKANVDWSDEFGDTPLNIAAARGHEAVVKLLLQNKAHVDLKERKGNTPLIRAAMYGHTAVVKLLLQYKADVNLKNDGGHTPLWFAAQRGHQAIVKLILETGQANVDLQDDLGRTPLSHTVDTEHEDVAKLLLRDSRVNVDSVDIYGQSPLLHAARSGHENMVNLLLKIGQANVNLVDDYNRSPLSHAAERGYEGVVGLLLETRQASVNLKDVHGRTPLSYAVSNKHGAVIKLLQSFGAL